MTQFTLPAPVLQSMLKSRLKSIADLVRLANVVTAAADISIGIILGLGEIAPHQAFALLMASACLYCSGMAWNDFFDRRIDAVERPNRPIPSGRITPTLACRLASSLTLAGLALSIVAGFTASGWNWQPGSIALLLVGLIMAYNAKMKQTRFGPWFMGGCRFANVLLGLSVISTDAAPWPLRMMLASAVGIYVAGLTVIARDEATQSQHSHIRNGMIIAMSGFVIGGLSPAFSPTPWSGGVYLLAAVALWLWRSMVPTLAAPNAHNVQQSVRRGIFAIILLDAGLAAGAAGPLGLLIVVWWLPGRFLARLSYST